MVFVWETVSAHACVCTLCIKEARERVCVAVGEMTGFGCDLLSYVVVIM